MSDYMDAREVKKVIEASIFNPTMRRDAKDFVDAQETRIVDLETTIERLKFAGGLNRDGLDDALARIVDLETALKQMLIEFDWMLLNGEYNDERNTIANKARALLKGTS